MMGNYIIGAKEWFMVKWRGIKNAHYIFPPHEWFHVI